MYFIPFWIVVCCKTKRTIKNSHRLESLLCSINNINKDIFISARGHRHKHSHARNFSTTHPTIQKSRTKRINSNQCVYTYILYSKHINKQLIRRRRRRLEIIKTSIPVWHNEFEKKTLHSLNKNSFVRIESQWLDIVSEKGKNIYSFTSLTSWIFPLSYRCCCCCSCYR